MEGLRDMDSAFSGCAPDRSHYTLRGTDLYLSNLILFLDTELSKIPVLTAHTTQRPSKLILLDPWLYGYLAKKLPGTNTGRGYKMAVSDICHGFKEERTNVLVSCLNSLVSHRCLNSGMSGLQEADVSKNMLLETLSFSAEFSDFQRGLLGAPPAPTQAPIPVPKQAPLPPKPTSLLVPHPASGTSPPPVPADPPLPLPPPSMDTQ